MRFGVAFASPQVGAPTMEQDPILLITNRSERGNARTALARDCFLPSGYMSTSIDCRDPQFGAEAGARFVAAALFNQHQIRSGNCFCFELFDRRPG